MLNKLSHIKANEKEYPIAFTMNVVEAIQEEYGTLENWGEKLQPTEKSTDPDTGEETIVKSEPMLKDVIWTFQQFINEGIDIENEERNEKKPSLSHKQIGRIITEIGLGESGELIRNMTVSKASGEEKNLTTPQNQSL